jgi:type II secretory pathway component PulJ
MPARHHPIFAMAREKLIPRAVQDEGGSTLIELLTSTAIFLMVAASAMAVLMIVVRNQPRISDRSAAVQEGRVLEERLIRELRLSSRVVTGSSTQVAFHTFVRRGSCGSSTPAAASDAAIVCRVTYTLSGGAISRTETDPAQTITPSSEQMVTGLQNTDVFSYSPSATSAEYVGVKLVFPTEDGEDSVTLTDGTDLRNR